MNHNTVKIGQQAEIDACQFLEKQGLTLITKNYKVKLGEIDLIMLDQEHYVFVEVRLRLNPNFGHSLETISKSKQQRIIRTALHYLQQEKLLDKVPCRFDTIGIGRDKKLLWIKDAFRVEYHF